VEIQVFIGYTIAMHYIIWLLTGVLYSPIFYQLYQSRWESIDYTHAYFILPVSVWLVWRKRAVLLRHSERSFQGRLPAGRQEAKNLISFFSIFLLLLGILMFIFGWRQDYLFISTLSLIPLLYGLIIYLYGTNIAKTLSFPILYLLLLVPPPLGVLDSITLPMRYGISILTEIIIKSLGLPIIRDGLLLSIGGHEIYMGAPCSGFRSLITMISLGLAYIYINKNSLKNKAILLFSIIPIALLGNLFRVIAICLVTFCYGEAIGKKFHDTSGFIIFLFMILGLIGMENILGKNKNEV
jgi:exosortase